MSKSHLLLGLVDYFQNIALFVRRLTGNSNKKNSWTFFSEHPARRIQRTRSWYKMWALHRSCVRGFPPSHLRFDSDIWLLVKNLHDRSFHDRSLMELHNATDATCISQKPIKKLQLKVSFTCWTKLLIFQLPSWVKSHVCCWRWLAAAAAVVGDVDVGDLPDQVGQVVRHKRPRRWNDTGQVGQTMGMRFWNQRVLLASSGKKL